MLFYDIYIHFKSIRGYPTDLAKKFLTLEAKGGSTPGSHRGSKVHLPRVDEDGDSPRTSPKGSVDGLTFGPSPRSRRVSESSMDSEPKPRSTFLKIPLYKITSVEEPPSVRTSSDSYENSKRSSLESLGALVYR